jgi:hypothetical protein
LTRAARKIEGGLPELQVALSERCGLFDGSVEPVSEEGSLVCCTAFGDDLNNLRQCASEGYAVGVHVDESGFPSSMAVSMA